MAEPDMETTFSNINALRNWRRMALTTIDSVYLKLCLYLLHLERESQSSKDAKDYAMREMRTLRGYTDLLLETQEGLSVKVGTKKYGAST